MRPARLDRDCVAARIMRDMDAPEAITCVEVWAREDALARRVASAEFSRLLAVMEALPSRPSWNSCCRASRDWSTSRRYGVGLKPGRLRNWEIDDRDAQHERQPREAPADYEQGDAEAPEGLPAEGEVTARTKGPADVTRRIAMCSLLAAALVTSAATGAGAQSADAWQVTVVPYMMAPR